MFYVKGKVIGIAEDQYENKDTKEKGEKQYFIEVFGQNKNRNVFDQSDVIRLKIKPEKVNEYKSKIGKEEEFQFSIYSKSQTFLTVI